MEFQNHTPFQPLLFESRDRELTDHGVVVLRGTFDLRPGERLVPCERQVPLVLADEYRGEPGGSSLRFESSLAPFKPRTDVLVTATAHSPSGRAEAAWGCSVAIDGVRATRFTVTGPRAFEQRSRFARRHVLSEIEPTKTVAVTYENAYGGAFIDERGERVAWGANPVGRGYVGDQRAERIEAPQLLPWGTQELTLGRPVETVGLGPIAPNWMPRVQHAGTYDGMWRRTRFPDLPADFDYRFYNTAPSELTLPRFARGDETIALENLGQRGLLEFRLPGYDLFTVMHLAGGRPVPGPVFLDTIHVVADECIVHLTWRAIVPSERVLEALHVRLRNRAGVAQWPLLASAG